MLGSGQVRYAFACTGMVLVVCVFFVSVLGFFDAHGLLYLICGICVLFLSLLSFFVSGVGRVCRFSLI